jgi:hypothetical protein
MLDVIHSITTSNQTDKLIKDYLLAMQLQIAPLSEKQFKADRGYASITIYPPNQDQPSIKILRHVSFYVDGAIGIQDEVYLHETTAFWQYNFEISKDSLITPSRIQKLEVALSEIQRLSLINGSRILVQHYPNLTKIAFNEKWLNQKEFNEISLPSQTLAFPKA